MWREILMKIDMRKEPADSSESENWILVESVERNFQKKIDIVSFKQENKNF